VCILFEDPVGNGIKVKEPRAHVGEEAVGIVFVSPEVLHSGETVKDISRTRGKVVFMTVSFLVNSSMFFGVTILTVLMSLTPS